MFIFNLFVKARNVKKFMKCSKPDFCFVEKLTLIQLTSTDILN